MKKEFVPLAVGMALCIALFAYAQESEENGTIVYWSEIKQDNKLSNEAMMADLNKLYGKHKDGAYLLLGYMALSALPFVIVYLVVEFVRGTKKVVTPVVEEISELQRIRDIRRTEKELEKMYKLKEKTQIEMKRLEVDKMLRFVEKPDDISRELKKSFSKWPSNRRDRVKLEITTARMINQLNGQFCMTEIMEVLDNVYGNSINSEERVAMIYEIKEWTEGGDFCSKYRVVDGVQYYKMIYL